jgi:mannosyltransferase
VARPETAPIEPVADTDDPLSTASGWGRWRPAFVLLVGGALVTGLVLRFWTQSPLWLDESLSVNIARLPIGQIPDALRHDGHPPLFYVLLHVWMDVWGSGDTAVRAFSGVWALALFPLVWVAARRLGGTRVPLYAVTVLALSPYAIRYATETRMYAMVMVLALAAWLVADDALRRPTVARLSGLAVLTGLLLWTHYWALWALGTAGLLLVLRAWRARRDDDAERLRPTLLVIGALVAGGVLFVPWLPALLYQGAHTGTPWARPVRPTEMVAYTLGDFGGGPEAEAAVLGWMSALVALVGLTGRAVGRFRIEIDLRTHRAARPFSLLIAGTFAVASAVGYATGATYASRYAAVLFPFFVLLVALGLDQVRSRPIAIGLLGGLLLLSGIGGVRNVVKDRSDAGRTVAAIRDRGRSGDFVVYCPDQLGPSASRLLGTGFRQVTYPRFEAPDLVDWVDYKERLAKASPEAFADTLLERAGGRRIFLVYSTDYTTHEQICPALFNAIGQRRPPEVLTQPTEAYEPASVVLFEVPKA